MENRYLFRGKRIDNGEWIFGNLIQTDNGAYIIQNYIPQNLLNKYKVMPLTICQCTDARDKNGKLMFENDILSAHLDDKFPEDETRTRVVWHENGWHTKEQGSDDYAELDDFDTKYFKVIGNMIDNPELLEV